MAFGRNGAVGVHVLSHVVEGSKAGAESVLDKHMVERTVLVMDQNKIPAKTSSVQLMAPGVPGVTGDPAVSPVGLGNSYVTGPVRTG